MIPIGFGPHSIEGFVIESRLNPMDSVPIYRARRLATRKIVTIRAMPEEIVKDRERAASIVTEFQSFARLSHPNIARVPRAVEAQGGIYFIITEPEGPSLAQVLEKLERVPVGHVLRIGIQLAGALQQAHDAGLVHERLSPELVFIKGGADALLSYAFFDWPYASKRQYAGRGDGPPPLGTEHYLAPELLEDRRLVSPSSDVYALGATLYRALTGRTPFRAKSLRDLIVALLQSTAEPPSRVDAAIPKELDRVLLRALGREREERYQTAAEFAADLDALFGRLAQDAKSPTIS